jgi:hypothetical protein
MERGQGKPSPYETLSFFAKKTRIYRMAIQRSPRGTAATKQSKENLCKRKHFGF